MKILFINAMADPELGGGAETVIWEQLRCLRDRGHECVLLASCNQSGLEQTEREGITIWKAGIRNVYWPFQKNRPATPYRLIWHLFDSYNPWMQGYLREIVIRERPDVASLHNLTCWSAASWKTLQELNVPAVQVLHDYYSICAKSTMCKGGRNCTSQCFECKFFRFPNRVLSSRVRAVIGVSKFILDKHLSLNYFNNAPIKRVIYNARSLEGLGVDSSSSSETHFGLRFGFIGRLDPVKGIESLIDAFLVGDLPDAELWIAGNGKQNYEDHLHKKTQDERVRFHGHVKASDFYPLIDVVVVPSLWNDNLPGVVYEALAFGKPVIGSRRGGIPEMIHHMENGLLFEPDTPGGLQMALEAMQNDQLRADLTARARPSSIQFVDMARCIKAYETLYDDMLTASLQAD